MALGKRNPTQPPLFVSALYLAALKPHPYYDALNKVLEAHHFDPFVEQLCAPFYAGNVGRPGLAPGVYFRCLIVGYLEGLDSRRASPPRRTRHRLAMRRLLLPQELPGLCD